MKVTRIICFLTLSLLMCTSCTRDDRGGKNEVTEKPNQARITLVLEVNDDAPAVARALEEAGSETVVADTVGGVVTQFLVDNFEQKFGSTSTRSVTAAVQESVIKDLWAIQFDENSKLVGQPIYQSGLAGKSQVTLMLTQTPVGKQHTVYFVANTHDENLFTENNVSTLTNYRKLMYTYANEAAVVAENALMMTGQYLGVLTDKATLSQAIRLTRTVAKITFNYLTSDFIDGTIRVLSVQLKNVAQCTAYLEPTTATYPTIGNHADYMPETAPAEATGTYTWYLPENVRGSNPYIAWEGSKSKKNAPAGQGDYATVVELRAEVTAKDGATRNISYLFFIGKDIADYSVKRNLHYQLTVDIRGIDEGDQRVIAGNSTPWLDPIISISGVTGTSATVGATIISDGGSALTQRGFYLSENKNEIGTTRAYLGAGLYVVPDTQSYFTRAAFVPEKVEQTLTGLKYNTTYYVRPFASNMYGTTVGEQGTFTTNGTPTIVTVEVNEVKATTAKVLYRITDNGMATITEQGVVYSTEKDFIPTATGVTKVSSSSLSELTLGTGVAGSSNPPLSANTTYYVRAYATNNAGTSYGSQLSLTTKKKLSFNVTATVVDGLYVEVTVGAGESDVVTSMGVKWDTKGLDPVTSGSLVEGTKVKDKIYSLKLGSTYPDVWYLYPAGQTEVGGEWYYGSLLANRHMPTSPKPVIVEGAGMNATNKVTIKVEAQTPGLSREIIEHGIAYSNAADFDPKTQVIRQMKDQTTPIPRAFQTFLFNMLPNSYFVRSYVVSQSSLTYYSAPSSFSIAPMFENRSSSIGTGEEISGNEALTFTLQFATNTTWKATGTGVTLSETSGSSTNWDTKSITMTTKRNEETEGSTSLLSVDIETITNGEEAPITYRWTLTQRAADVYEAPVAGVYVRKAEETMRFFEAGPMCTKWGGRLPTLIELSSIFAAGGYGIKSNTDYMSSETQDVDGTFFTLNTSSTRRSFYQNTSKPFRCVRETLDKK